MKYKKLKNIGRGSFGNVYKVSDENNKIYALKEISLLNKQYKENYGTLTELNILYYNTNGYILKYYDVYIEHYNLCIVTDFYEKGDLQRGIKLKKDRNKYFTEHEIWKMFLDLSCGINYIHSHNIIHRDLKTANIFVDNNNRAIIGDFGISKILGKIDNTSTKIGTPLYFSPELISKSKYDKKVDVWGLGCILYEIITLKQPFQNSKSYAGLYKKIVAGDYQKIKNINNYSNDLIKTVYSLLEVDPNKRLSIPELLSLDYIKKRLIKYNYNISNHNKDIINITHLNIPNNIYTWRKVLKNYNKKTENKLEPINKNEVKKQEHNKNIKLEKIVNIKKEINDKNENKIENQEIKLIPIQNKNSDINNIIQRVNNVKKTLKSLAFKNNNNKYKIHCDNKNSYAKNYAKNYSSPYGQYY